MTNGQSTVRGVFQMYDNCPHCHQPLKRMTVSIFGRQKEVTCFGSCGCEGAIRQLEAYTPDEPIYAESGHRCPMCGDEMRLDVRSGYVSCCPQCGHEMVFKSDLDAFNELVKTSGLDLNAILFEAGIPLRYLRREVDLLGYQGSVHGGKSLYVSGPNGCGKSTFAANLSKALVNMGRKVLFRNSKLLTEEIKKTFDGKDTGILDRCFNADVLVIDDLGKEQPTEYSLSMLYAIVEARYGEMRPLVVTSNYTRADLGRRLGQVDKSTAMAIVSRLCDGVETYEMDGRDWRVS